MGTDTFFERTWFPAKKSLSPTRDFHLQRKNSFCVESIRGIYAKTSTEVIHIFFKFRFRKKVERDPKKELLIFVLTIVLLLVAFMGTLRYIVIKSSPLRTKADRQLKDLHFSLKMDNNSVYSVSEKVLLKLGVKNISEKPVVIEFPSSLECDFLVEQELDLFFVKIPFIVWKYSAKMGDVDTGHSLKIDPGKEKIFKAEWDQTNFKGEPVKPGKYRITGIMNTRKFKISLQLRGASEKN
jgi:hypothetical protein